jgi:type IV secretory pathway TrbD component
VKWHIHIRCEHFPFVSVLFLNSLVHRTWPISGFGLTQWIWVFIYLQNQYWPRPSASVNVILQVNKNSYSLVQKPVIVYHFEQTEDDNQKIIVKWHIHIRCEHFPFVSVLFLNSLVHRTWPISGFGLTRYSPARSNIHYIAS